VWILCANVMIRPLIIYNLQSQTSGFGVPRSMQGRVHPRKTRTQTPPSCLQGVQSIEAWMQPAAWKKYGGTKKYAHFYESWGKERLRGGGINIKLLEHIFTLFYNFTSIFFKKPCSLSSLDCLWSTIKNASMWLASVWLNIWGRKCCIFPSARAFLWP